MSSVLSTSVPAAQVQGAHQAVLPPFGFLALAGFSANAPFAAFGFLVGRPWPAVSLLSGYVLGLVLYGILYATVTRGFTVSKVSGRRMPAGFALLMIGKFLAVGVVLFILLCVFNVAAVWLLVGFLVTQAGVTAAVMKCLKNTKVTD